MKGLPTVPAATPPAGLTPRLQALYRSIDQAQRQRPSVAAQRLQDAWLTQARQVERSGIVLAHHITRYSWRGYTPRPPDQRHTFAGVARRLRSPVAQLVRSVQARDRGEILQDRWRNVSTPRLRALLTNRKSTYDRGGLHQ